MKTFTPQFLGKMTLPLFNKNTGCPGKFYGEGVEFSGIFSFM